MKDKIRTFASKYLWRFIYHIRYFKYLLFLNRTKELILVLTPGKVGSSSVYSSLKSKYKKSHYIFHIHFVSQKNIEGGIEIHKNSQRGSVPNHFITSQILRRLFLKNGFKIKVITLFREPINRYLSDHFQNSDRSFKSSNGIQKERMCEIIECGLQNMEHIKYLENWIEDELINELGIDFYKIVKSDKGSFFLYQSQDLDFLALRLEDLNSIFSLAIKEFMGNEIKLQNTNVGAEKSYSELYKRIKSSVEVSEETLSKTRESQLYRTLYKDFVLNSNKD